MFKGCLDSNPESCRNKQARYQLLATSIPLEGLVEVKGVCPSLAPSPKGSPPRRSLCLSLPRRPLCRSLWISSQRLKGGEFFHRRSSIEDSRKYPFPKTSLRIPFPIPVSFPRRSLWGRGGGAPNPKISVSRQISIRTLALWGFFTSSPFSRSF